MRELPKEESRGLALNIIPRNDEKEGWEEKETEEEEGRAAGENFPEA